MIAFICLFFPAMLSVALFEGLTKQNLNAKRVVFRYCFNTVFINLICFSVKKFILGTAEELFYGAGFDITVSAAINYITLSLSVAAVITIVEVLLSKKVKIFVKEDQDSDEKKA